MGIFDKLFGKNEENQKSFSVNILENGVEINNQSFSLPLNFENLRNLFGNNFVQTENDTDLIYTWDNLGFKFFISKTDKSVKSIMIKTKESETSYLPKNVLNGKLKIKNQDYESCISITEKDYLFKDIAIGNIKLTANISKEEPKQIVAFFISEIIKKEKKKSDKYEFKKISGEKIEFKDFNFKLAIIEELMYNKKILTPKFDVYEFGEFYDKREIDIEEDGYEPIPEVVEYFKKLEIDKKFAEEITEIYQDGGNEIYMNIMPFWDGEDDEFNIRNYEDLKYFPNLKKMTLFETDPKIFEELKSKGIDAKPL